MALSIVEIAAAREQVATLLDELGLAAYLFEIEPGAEQWQLKVECAVGAGDEWESISLPISKERLLASAEQASTRRALIEELRAPLSACKRRA